jgi:hypothetical protein
MSDSVTSQMALMQPATSFLDPFAESRAWDPPQPLPPAHTIDSQFINPFEAASAHPSLRGAHSDAGSAPQSPMDYGYTTSVRSRIAQFDRDRASMLSNGEVSPFTGSATGFPAQLPPPSPQSPLSPYSAARPPLRPASIRPSFRTTRSYTRDDLEEPEPAYTRQRAPSVAYDRSGPTDDMDLFFEEVRAFYDRT